MQQLQNDATELIANTEVKWSSPDFAAAISRDLIEPLKKHLADDSVAFYGNMT
jgi:hypothetical protein